MVAKKAPQKKTARKTTAKKKTAKKKRMLLFEDPPIIVGGGSSTYIWVLKGLSPGTPNSPGALLPEANPTPDYPINNALYNCYDIGVDLVSYDTHDGSNQGGPHDIKNRRKHRTKFRG